MKPQQLVRCLAATSSLDNIYVVGGAVRDRLLGRPVLDVDVALPSNPELAAAKFAAALKGNSFPLDKARGIIRVHTPDGFHLDVVKFQGKDFNADIDRRDFTINAMAVPLKDWGKPNWKNALIDRHKGVRDLKSRRIHPLSSRVFNDDPLRMLRALRIAAELNFKISPTTQAAINKNHKKIKRAAPERVREESFKFFSTRSTANYLRLMDKTKLLESVFPEAIPLKKTAANYYGKGGVLKHVLDSIERMEDVFDNLKSWFPRHHKKIQTHLDEKIGQFSRSAHLKWGLLLHDVGKPKTAKKIDGRLRFFEHEFVGAKMIPKMMLRYRWSQDESNRFSRLVQNHMRPGNLAAHPPVTDRAIHRFYRDLGDDAIGMLLVSLGDHLSYLTPRQRKKRASAHEKITIKMINQFYEKKEKVLPPKLINGNDVMKILKIKPSPLVGELLRDVTDAQAEGTIKTQADAIAFLKNRIDHYA